MTTIFATAHSLHHALKAVIANMPDTATEIDIRLRPKEIPEMSIVQHMVDANGRPEERDGECVTEFKKFVIVPEHKWDALRQAARHLLDIGSGGTVADTMPEIQAAMDDLEVALK